MLQFLKYFFATLLALVVFFFFIFIILIGIGVSASRKSEVQIKAGSILKLDLSEEISDEFGNDPFEDISFPGFPSSSKISLPMLTKAIAAASQDDNIKGIFLTGEVIGAGPAVALDIREALKAFRATGKKVYAYAEVYSEGAYFVNSVADSVFLLPTGYLEVNGLFSETVFISGFLEKIGVKPEIFKVGTFKSAVEPLERKDMSEANKLQTASFLKGIYTVFLNEVASSRKMTVEKLTQISDSMLVRNAKDAQSFGLVDRLAYYDGVEHSLHALSGLDSAEDVRFVSLKKYHGSIKEEKNTSKNRIAVIVAEGDIVSTTEDDESMDAQKIATEIRKARKDEKIKAIVLRVNSPGGSAIASDLVWREVMLTKGVKPIIASMSTLAASGGYYIAMACDTIVAQPNTITGSIGVFGVLFNVETLINDRIGVYSDGVKTGTFSDFGNPARPLTPFERAMVQQEVQEIYDDFTGKAANNRRMKLDSLQNIAEGRVWAGSDAKAIGLVDVLGGIGTAIQLAASAAGVADDFKVRYYPAQKPLFEKIFENISTEVRTRMLKQELGMMYQTYRKAQKALLWHGYQARLPLHIEFH